MYPKCIALSVVYSTHPDQEHSTERSRGQHRDGGDRAGKVSFDRDVLRALRERNATISDPERKLVLHPDANAYWQTQADRNIRSYDRLIILSTSTVISFANLKYRHGPISEQSLRRRVVLGADGLPDPENSTGLARRRHSSQPAFDPDVLQAVRIRNRTISDPEKKIVLHPNAEQHWRAQAGDNIRPRYRRVLLIGD